MKIHGNIGCLRALQKLKFIEVDDDDVSQLERLTQWRNCSSLCSALQKMTCLNTIYVFSVNEEEFLDLQSMSDPPPLLQTLYLYGPLVNNELPHWIAKQISLVKIGLH